MGAEPQDIYSKIEARKCDRAYAYAKDLDAKCDACGEKVGDHQTPLSLRGVIAMLNVERKNTLIEMKKQIVSNYGSPEELMQREVIASELPDE